MNKFYIFLLVILIVHFNAFSNDLGQLLSSSSSNYMNVLYSYDVVRNVVNVDPEGKPMKETGSTSHVKFIYDNSHYMLKTDTVHNNGIDKNTEAFYYWTPETYHELLSGTTLNGAIYSPILSVKESTFNPITHVKDEGGIYPFVLHHTSWGIYEPFTFGLFPMKLFLGEKVFLEDRNLQELNNNQTVEIDLTKPCENIVMKDIDENVLDTNFAAVIQNTELGCVIREYTHSYTILLEFGRSVTTINFIVDQFSDQGYPIKGQYNSVSKSFKGDELMISHHRLTSWDNMKITLIPDIEKYVMGVIDDL